MNDSTASKFPIRVSDLSRNLIDQASRAIGAYTTPLIYEDRLIGSATFVTVDDICGFLTAFHVADLIDFSSGSLGLAITDRPHRFEIELLHLTHIPLAKPRDEFGPDISFTRIPESSKLSEIRARKSFYPLRGQLCAALETDGLWMVVGHPGILQTDEMPSVGDFSRVIGFPGIGACSGIDRTFNKHGLDVIEIGVDYSGRSEALATFGGMSGGGVWRVPLYRAAGDETNEVFFEEFYLCGVAFWQSGNTDGKGYLRCQGPRTIYEFVPDRIRAAIG